MRRRRLFGLLGAAVAAAPFAAVTGKAEAAETEAARLVRDLLAHPGTYPEIEALARELMGSAAITTGGLSVTGNATLDGAIRFDTSADIVRRGSFASHVDRSWETELWAGDTIRIPTITPLSTQVIPGTILPMGMLQGLKPPEDL